MIPFIIFHLILENSFIHEKKRTTKSKWVVEEEDGKETRIGDVDVDADTEQKYLCIFYITYIQTWYDILNYIRVHKHCISTFLLQGAGTSQKSALRGVKRTIAKRKRRRKTK